MEKNVYSKSLKILPVKVYLEDLDEIISILNEDGPRKIEIKTREYKLTPDEFKQKYKDANLNYLEINSHSPYINVSFDYSNGVRIYSGDDSASSVGIIEKIKNVVKPKRKIFNLFLGKSNLNLSIFFILCWFFFLLFFKPLATKDVYLGGLIVYIVFSALFMAPLFNRNNIIVSNKKDRPNFFIRKSDDLVIAIISAFLGGAIGAIAMYFIK